MKYINQITMDRTYTIHDHDGLKFINLSGGTIITNDGREYEAEDFELRARVVLLFGNEPDNVPADILYKAKFAEILHIPMPEDQQWVDTLPEGVLVVAKPKICNTYDFPVCMFKTKAQPNGIRYADPGLIIWKKR